MEREWKEKHLLPRIRWMVLKSMAAAFTLLLCSSTYELLFPKKMGSHPVHENETHPHPNLQTQKPGTEEVVWR